MLPVLYDQEYLQLGLEHLPRILESYDTVAAFLAFEGTPKGYSYVPPHPPPQPSTKNHGTPCKLQFKCR